MGRGRNAGTCTEAVNRDPQRAAVEIAGKKICGGRPAPFFKKPYLDAAFNGDLFFWDTCMLAGWAKHTPSLPIRPALDTLYRVQRASGFICRQISPEGEDIWDPAHPISVNPPLLAWAEMELQQTCPDLQRLRRVYPSLVRFHRFLESTYRCEDGLFFSDAHGSGMDNISRSPRGWKPDGLGLRIRFQKCHPSARGFARAVSNSRDLDYSPLWNRQGRSVDFSAQMAFDARRLSEIADLLGKTVESAAWAREADDINAAINRLCWNPRTGFYCDLGFGKKLPRRHIGMFWTLWSGAAADCSMIRPLVRSLRDPGAFGRPVPVPSLPADDPDYCPWGNYWRGGVWAPTTYMVLRGLREVGEEILAASLAAKIVGVVDRVFEATGTFWENYSPEFPAYGLPARPDFCGWTALIPIAVRREFSLR